MVFLYRFGAPLYFANATFFEEEVEKLVAQAAHPIKWFVLDAEAMKVDAPSGNKFKTVGQYGLVPVIAKVDALKVNIFEIPVR